MWNPAMRFIYGSIIVDERQPVSRRRGDQPSVLIRLSLPAQIGTFTRVLSPKPIINERPAAPIPINNVSNPDFTQPASDHRLFAAPMPKNTRPVATTHETTLYAMR